MKKSILACFLFIFFAFAWQWTHQEREKLIHSLPLGYTLPSAFTAPMSLRYKGLISDFLFLKTVTTIGQQMQEKVVFTLEHKTYIQSAIAVITDLDTHFWDPYFFASMVLAWDYRDSQAANDILHKAIKNRPWDWRPAYFYGFNCYYFQKDIPCASKWLTHAATLDGSPSYLPLLAARLSVYSHSHKPAILMLKQALSENKNPAFAQDLIRRIDALESLDLLEDAVLAYQKKHQKKPATLQDLVDDGILEKIPEDPYGGSFYLLENGRVFTTSKMHMQSK
jgi:hypothetical protein